jgi:hypothetical protein
MRNGRSIRLLARIRSPCTLDLSSIRVVVPPARVTKSHGITDSSKPEGCKTMIFPECSRVARALVVVISLIGFSAGISGCASSFNSEIAKTTAGPKVPVVNCKSEASEIHPVPEAMDRPRVNSAKTVAKLFVDESGRTRSDLELGIEMMRSSIPEQGGAPSIARDAARTFQSQFKINSARFFAELPMLDPLGADAADKAVSSKAATALVALRTEDAVAVSRDEWQEYVNAVGRATSTSGWTASMARSLGAAARAYAGGSKDAHDKSAADLQKKYYIAVYMQAYFRNGPIFQLNFDDQNLKTQLMNKVKQKITDPKLLSDVSTEIDTVTSDFKKQFCKQDGGQTADCSILGVIGQQTFVTRAGKSYGFPGVTATLDPVGNQKVSTNKIKWNDILEDLVRVSVEAAGDSLAGVPGVANSTMCKEMNNCVDPKNSDEAKLIEQVNNVGDQTEAGASTLISTVVRGGWLFSLNNEALAEYISTGVSVGARKVAEEVVWKKGKGQCAKDTAHRDVTVTVP